MSAEILHALAPDMLELFARKGMEGGARYPQIGNANGVKIRRITRCVHRSPAPLLHAVRPRSPRLEIAKRLRLTNLTFEQNDVRTISVSAMSAADGCSSTPTSVSMAAIGAPTKDGPTAVPASASTRPMTLKRRGAPG